ncbi:MAG: prephenate dehydrogenase/arogenate dehydrogenase family protein [Hydrogenophilus sp.]|nr:prephenate dehydrogenase/arogenate dehydrogenase family protein [Hydrogenophilus sp.]
MGKEERDKVLVRRLTVVGVGLIGGSFALALRERGLVAEVVGIGRNAATVARAKVLGIVDRAATDPAAVSGADVVVLAVPVAQTEAVAAAIAPYLSPTAIVTDVGSTKGDVVAAFRRQLSSHLARVVPGHPIAGKEVSGPEAAAADLFVERRVVLTPLAENDPQAVARVASLWEACGAVVTTMTPERHDRLFAAVSHLPHWLSFALVAELAARADADELFSYAAGGFRDFTRIAGSHPEMWRDICLANRTALLAEVDAYSARLTQLRQLLEEGDGAGLFEVFAAASRARNRWVAGLSVRGETSPE